MRATAGVSFREARFVVKDIETQLQKTLLRGGRDGCQWVFSCEDDLQGYIFALAFNRCQKYIWEHVAWLGMEAQPHWFLQDLGTELFDSYGFFASLANVRQLMRGALAKAQYDPGRPRVDVALLLKRQNQTPHLHVWETKFYSEGSTPSRVFAHAKRDAQRILSFKVALQPVMHVTGEVVWLDPFSGLSPDTWERICREVLAWNKSNRSVPIRLWAFSASSTVLAAGWQK